VALDTPTFVSNRPHIYKSGAAYQSNSASSRSRMMGLLAIGGWNVAFSTVRGLSSLASDGWNVTFGTVRGP